jgi:SAM-dependent methyltransferase
MLARTPEPELMDDPAQARAYAQADFNDVDQRFVDLFCAVFPDRSTGDVLDLGCGPAGIPIRLASARPALRITGLDASGPMLAEARAAVEGTGLRGTIALVRARLPDLPFPLHRFEAVISNSLLHHLPDPSVLWRAAVAAARRGAALLVMDLLRPESRDAARDLVDRYAATETELLRRDFYRSLLAAFTLDEVADQLAHAGLASLERAVVSDRHWAAWGVV